MTEHVHLFLTPNEKDSIGNLMKQFWLRHVHYTNRTYPDPVDRTTFLLRFKPAANSGVKCQ